MLHIELNTFAKAPPRPHPALLGAAHLSPPIFTQASHKAVCEALRWRRTWSWPAAGFPKTGLVSVERQLSDSSCWVLGTSCLEGTHLHWSNRLKKEEIMRTYGRVQRQNDTNERGQWQDYVLWHKYCVNSAEQTHQKEPSVLSWRLRWFRSRGSYPCAGGTWPRKTTLRSDTSTGSPAWSQRCAFSPVCWRGENKTKQKVIPALVCFPVIGWIQTTLCEFSPLVCSLSLVLFFTSKKFFKLKKIIVQLESVLCCANALISCHPQFRTSESHYGINGWNLGSKTGGQMETW